MREEEDVACSGRKSGLDGKDEPSVGFRGGEEGTLRHLGPGPRAPTAYSANS